MKRTVALLALLLSMIAATMLPASAVKPVRTLLPPNDDVVIEGVCDFPVLLHDLRAKITLKTFFDQAGNFVKEIGSGKLVSQLTNLASGESIIVNISGPGVLTAEGDEVTLKARGNWLFFFFPGELGPGHPGLIWLTTGQWVWRFGPGGGSLVESHGRSRDVCALLA